jgi:hypothetical protein
MLDWLKSYVFIAAWSSAIIALIALIRKKSDPTNPLNWGDVVLYVGFLSALAAVVTPGIDPDARSAMRTLLFMSLGAIIVRAGLHK